MLDFAMGTFYPIRRSFQPGDCVKDVGECVLSEFVVSPTLLSSAAVVSIVAICCLKASGVGFEGILWWQ
jgi:hypothetical protein